MKFREKNITVFFMISFLFLLTFFNCGNKAPSYNLELNTFTLKMPNLTPDKYFHSVTDIDITPENDIIILDPNGPAVLRFDSEGNLVNNLYGNGASNYKALCSINPVNDLLALQTAGMIEYFRRDGKPENRYFIKGRGDIAVAPDGRFVINRMYDAFRLGNCLETYDADGKLLNKFRSPRCQKEEQEILDFSFSGFTKDNKIVYIPATVDSGFIYDFDGNLVLAKKIKSKLKPYKLENDSPGVLIEDAYICDDGIFIVRPDKELSTEDIIYFDFIEHYDFNFDLIARYTFAKPLTMTVITPIYSPWYHKFCYDEGIFYFVVSQPFEQLITFKVSK